jgi:Arc/MetJ family transcription regulator
MHRTTINLDEAVYLRVKRLARRKGKSLARTIEDLLRVALGSGAASEASPPLHRGNGPQPGVDIADRERLYDLMERR